MAQDKYACALMATVNGGMIAISAQVVEAHNLEEAQAKAEALNLETWPPGGNIEWTQRMNDVKRID